MKSKFHFNPMAEFMHENFEDSEVEEMFEEFKKTHGKSYNDPAEHEQRKHIFRHNMRSVRRTPVGFRATLNCRKFKVALNLIYGIFYHTYQMLII